MKELSFQTLEELSNELSTKLSTLDLQLSSSSLLSSSRRLLGLHNQNASVLASQCPGYDFYLNSCEDQSGGGSNGDTFFLIICAALVLFMTIPGIISPFTSLHFTSFYFTFLSSFLFLSFFLSFFLFILFFLFLLQYIHLNFVLPIKYCIFLRSRAVLRGHDPQTECSTRRPTMSHRSRHYLFILFLFRLFPHLWTPQSLLLEPLLPLLWRCLEALVLGDQSYLHQLPRPHYPRGNLRPF